MSTSQPLQSDWNFRRQGAAGAWDSWTVAELPHSPFIADLDGREHWFGICQYARTLRLACGAGVARCALRFGAAMHSARVFLDGIEVGAHSGGYLPFEIDLGRRLHDGAEHRLVVELDNRENADIPPGKPYGELDFCWYGGLYRDAALIAYPELHLTHPQAVACVAGGGVFVRTLSASAEEATLSVKVQLQNETGATRKASLRLSLLDGERSAAPVSQVELEVAATGFAETEQLLRVPSPRLWNVDTPVLHTLRVEVLLEGRVLDTQTQRVGIRRIAFSRSGGFTINGQRRRLRGTNRHQENPGAGYAVPAAADRRDARRIKEAGFDYIRLSHYPQSPAFMDACDELGLVVMNAIPGWQFIGGETFRKACVENARQLIRRGRNHPCVVLWELSLNETQMDDAFMQALHAAGHEEYPGDQMFTCGWMDSCYDVYIHSRQHGQIHRWQNGDKALVVAEYGDWEFYASNHGFDQTTGAGVFNAWSNARQRRRDGERGLRQQAWNHVIALNDTMSSPAVFDGQWCVFDYARGYHPERAACGVMDVHRLPKFSYHFYRSQRDPQENGQGWETGPVVFIASHWIPSSDLNVLVFSNAEEVELRLNGELLARQRPAFAWMTQYLPHPPFLFQLPSFTPGTLEARAFIAGKCVATHRVGTPGQPTHLRLKLDTLGGSAPVGEPDLIVVHAELTDGADNICIQSSDTITLAAAAPHLRILGPASVQAEAGIASFSLRLEAPAKQVELTAACRALSAKLCQVRV